MNSVQTIAPEQPTPPPRDEMRRRLLRANTAMAIILGLLVALAVATVLQSLRSARSQRRAEVAEQDGREKLRHSLLAQARAVRLSDRMGRRAEGLEAIRAATLIRPGRELRDEAIAFLALPDLEETGFSWPFPEGAGTVAYDPAHERFAVALPGGEIILHSFTNPAPLCKLPQQTTSTNVDIISYMGFSRDGRRLEVRYWRAAVLVWDVAAREVIWRGRVDQSKGPPAIAPVLSDDGRWLCLYDREREGRLTLFDAGTLQEQPFHRPPQEGYFACVQPGRPVLAVVNGSEVVLWDWEQGRVVRTFSHPARLRRVTFDHAGGRLATACYNNDVFVWNVATGEYQILSGHSAVTWHLAFSPDDAMLLTVAYDETSRLWDVNLGRTLVTTSQGYGLGFSGNSGRIVAVAENRRLTQWRVIRGDGYQIHYGEGRRDLAAWHMDLSRTNHLLALLADETLSLWSLGLPAATFRQILPGARSVLLEPDGQGLFLCRSNGLEHRVVLREHVQGRVVLRLGEARLIPLPQNARPYRAGLSADGHMVAVETEEQGGFAVRLAEPTRATKLEGHMTFRMARPAATATGGGMTAVSGDQRWVASGYGSITGPRVYDARTGQTAREFGKTSAHVAFSPDSRQLAVATAEHLRVFDTGTWALRWEKRRSAHASRQGLAAFAADGNTLAFDSDRRFVRLLDAATGEPLAAFMGPHAQTAHTLRYTAADGFLAIGTANNLVEVWNLWRIREQLRPLGLDWSPSEPPASDPVNGSPPRSVWLASLAVSLPLACVSVAAVLALLSLRRHRHLVEDFARAEDLAAQRERALRIEREVSALKTTFVSMVSHEFRTPLGVISVSGEVLQRYHERLTPQQRAEHLDAIIDSVRRMSRMMEDALLLSRVDSGRMEFKPAAIDLAGFCRKLVDEVLSATNHACPIQLDCRPEPDGPGQADEALLRHILTNLLSNGVKYSPPDKPVRLQVRRQGTEAVFVVSDQGMGIPPADQPHLFTAFHRAPNVQHIHGTGLGLVIVKRCCDLHRGSIRVESRLGCGTTFTVALPMFDPD